MAPLVVAVVDLGEDMLIAGGGVVVLAGCLWWYGRLS
jgi:hypothetical protein